MATAAMSQFSVQTMSNEGAGHAPVHFFYHVPKCAGTTIHRHLATVLPMNAYHRTKKRRGLSRFITRYDPAKLPDPRETKAVGGHFLGISIESFFAGRPVQRSILLREPVSHFVSYYNFRMMRYIAQGLRPYSFEVAYGATQRNFITHYILRNFLELPWVRLACLSDSEKYDLVNAFLATFWYVGDYRLCDDLIAALGGPFGIPTKTTPCNTQTELRRRVSWTPLAVDSLSSDMIAEIRAENLLDQRLWETWREARDNTSSIRPRALGGVCPSGFITNEATRFVSQILRRVQRGWGYLDDVRVPAAQGGSAVPI
jgi:hypothetical protein